MIDRHLQSNHCGSLLKPAMILALLVAWLPLSAAIAQDDAQPNLESQTIKVKFSPATSIAQDDAQPNPKSQTIKVQVVDEEGTAIEDASLMPTMVAYQQKGRNHFFGIEEESAKTDGQGEATFVFPVGDKGPIIIAYLQANHDSFIKNAITANISDELVTITLKRGLQVAASALDPVTKKPIKKHLYALTNQNSPVDWEVKSNGTLISPVLGERHDSFRLVQFDGGKAIRYSKLIDIFPRDKSRLRFSDLEMIDAVTISGKLSDEVPRPVKAGMVNCCVASISQHQEAAIPSRTWCWKSFSKLNPDGTFTLEGIPANSVLQVHCACQGWSNKPLTRDQILAEFPKEANNNSKHPLPQLFQIGEQDTEITVAMQPLGSVTVNVVDQDDQPIKNARAKAWVVQKYFYSDDWSTYDATLSSARRLAKLRSASPHRREPADNLISDLATPLAEDRTGFQKEFSHHNYTTDPSGSIVINGIPPSNVRVTAKVPNGASLSQQLIVRSNENVDLKFKFTLNRIDSDDGGDDE